MQALVSDGVAIAETWELSQHLWIVPGDLIGLPDPVFELCGVECRR